MLLSKESNRYGFSVSHTTRGRRPGEEEGVDYHFTTRETILADIAAGKFLEHATVHGNLYGTSFDAIRRVQDAGKICILDIDVQVGMYVNYTYTCRMGADGLTNASFAYNIYVCHYQGVVSVKAAATTGRIKDLMPIYVFIAPPSMAVLEERLRGRDTEKEEDVVR